MSLYLKKNARILARALIFDSPMGVFAPGFKTMGVYFQDMWKDAEANREKWGCGCLAAHRDCFVANSVIDLGKSDSMTMATAGGNATVTISYWKDMEHLHAFANGPSHRLGWDWWAAENKKYPHIGIMHETYAVPKDAWENIYWNFQPIGMGESIANADVPYNIG